MLYQGIEVSWRNQKESCLLRLLHTLKGCAGQGGLEYVHELAQGQETLISQGGWPSSQDIRDLLVGIRQKEEGPSHAVSGYPDGKPS
ncbi:HPt (histidine-containing phosphotransfer) domain-containing protein [Pseudomonas frederiksbergensis]|uniref:Hpt domain-containing protein n=1 Tax=Pseudomonas frederiksbergensis TaxID=104087 RepID=UPI003D233F91